MPAASCPSTIGKGRVQSPLMTCQSLWQTPVAITRTLASPAWGPCCSTSTTSSGVFALYRIAAFITAPPVWRGLGDGSLRWAQSSRIRARAKARRVLRKCDRWARWLPEVERFEKHRRPAIALGQGLEPEAPLDEFQDRRVVVQALRDHAAPRVWRDDQRRHARAEPEGVDHGRRHMVEPAAALVVRDHHRDARPGAARHDRRDDLADPAFRRAEGRGDGVGVLLPVGLDERDGGEAALAECLDALGGRPGVRPAPGALPDPPDGPAGGVV